MKRGGVRILAGRWQGRRLEVPGKARPTGSKVREALFSIWQGHVEGCRFLDLFAGSGAVGVEALSRGAASSTFVDVAKPALAALRGNLQQLGETSSRLVPLRLPRIGRKLGRDFDLVFADPPYDFQDYATLLQEVLPLIAPDGELVIEFSSRVSMPQVAGWEQGTTRRYGESSLGFFQPTGVLVEG